MKKLFTIDDFMVAFISALGYGFGYTIPMHLGWPQLACMVSSFALGIELEELISKLVFSKTVQQKTVNRVFTFVTILLVFLIAEFVSMRLLGTSLIGYRRFFAIPSMMFIGSDISRAVALSRENRLYIRVCGAYKKEKEKATWILRSNATTVPSSARRQTS